MHTACTETHTHYLAVCPVTREAGRQAVLLAVMGACQSGCEVTGLLLAAWSPGAGKPGRVNTRSWFHRAAERDEIHSYKKKSKSKHDGKLIHVGMYEHNCRENEERGGTQAVIRKMDMWACLKYTGKEAS